MDMDSLDSKDKTKEDKNSVKPDSGPGSPADPPATATPKYQATIEPMLFVLILAVGVSGVSVQNFYMEKICLSVYGNNGSLCGNLTADGEKERAVQAIYSEYSTYETIISLSVPCILSMFVAPWMDNFGSKLGMVLPLFGFLLSFLAYLLFSVLTVPFQPAFLLLVSIPSSFTGGLLVFSLAVFTFIAKITTTGNRTMRMALIQICCVLAAPIGILLGGQILAFGSYPAVFATSSGLLGLALCMLVVRVDNDGPGSGPEEMGEKDESGFASTTIRSKVAAFFDISSFLDTVRTFFKKRDGSKRLFLMLLLATICNEIMASTGSGKITYSYTRAIYGWDATTFSTYTVVAICVTLSGSGLLTLFGMKLFHLPDTFLGVICAVSALSAALTHAFASSAPYLMYAGAGLGLFSGLTSIVIRSMMSQLVPNHELGKVFSFVGTAQATVPLISTAIFNSLYKASLSWSWTGLVYFLSAGLHAITICAFIIFHCTMKNELPMVAVKMEPEHGNGIGIGIELNKSPAVDTHAHVDQEYTL